jgi:hypothetical protein
MGKPLSWLVGEIAGNSLHGEIVVLVGGEIAGEILRGEIAVLVGGEIAGNSVHGEFAVWFGGENAGNILHEEIAMLVGEEFDYSAWDDRCIGGGESRGKLCVGKSLCWLVWARK